MSELDRWVTKHPGRVCGHPAYHIYRCIKKEGLAEDTIFMGARLAIDESTYEVCGIDFAEVGDGTWALVYAHYVPEATGDWNGLYGDPELASDS